MLFFIKISDAILSSESDISTLGMF
jgi:hypothetical protein